MWAAPSNLKRRSWTINILRSSKNSSALWTFLILLGVCGVLIVSDDSSTKSNTQVDDGFPKKKCETALQMCHCYVNGNKAGIICRNVKDFAAFDQTLGDGSLFKKNTTYEITLRGSQTLPQGFLSGLVVYFLYVDDPVTQKMDEQAFEGILHLATFRVSQSSLREIPDFSFVRDSLRELWIENSLLIALEEYKLKDLPLLESVSFFNNSVHFVAQEAFQGTNNVVSFDISYNRLTSLPQKLFDSWKKLKTLRLSHNNLLHVNLLFKITHPTFLYLDYNSLTDLDSVLHPSMLAVETLQLSYNPFSEVTVDSFNGKVNNILYLYLDHCLIREFNVSHYQNLSMLETLDLSYNEIEKVTNQTISFGNDVELYFAGNKIKEFSVEFSYHVKSVCLNNNFLKSLSRALPFSQMTEVSVAENLIGSLEPEDFKGVQGVLEELYLQGNNIAYINRLTFENIRKNLRYLNLSRNRIRSLEGCVQFLSSLMYLNLTDNLIEEFEEREFSGLNVLMELYLEGNRIVTLGNELQRLDQLRYLVISHNRIQRLKREQIPGNLQYLYLEGNPFKCDCELFPFLQLLNLTKAPKTDVALCTSQGSSSFHRQPSGHCPDNCRCHCSTHSKRHFMMVNCSSTNPNQLPDLFRMSNDTTIDPDNSSFMVIHVHRGMKDKTLYSFVIEDEIGGVDLSDNRLQSLDNARFPAKLRILFISKNQLRQLPTTLLNSLTELSKVTLSCNPWSCDCGNLGFKNWISRAKVVVDASETRCSPDNREAPGLRNRTIWSLTDLDLCPINLNIYILTALAVVSLLLVLAVSKIMCTWYHNTRAVAVET